MLIDYDAAVRLLAERECWLCDLDGTLVDSLAELKGVYWSFMLEQGWQPSDTEFEEMNGPTIPTIVELLAQRNGHTGAVQTLVERYQSLIAERVSNQITAMPGANEFLKVGSRSSHRLALVTSSLRPSVNRIIKNLGWQCYFDTIICGDDVLQAKPAPDLYLAASRVLGCSTSACVAIEDSDNGVAAARAARMQVVRVHGEGHLQGVNLEELAAALGDECVRRIH